MAKELRFSPQLFAFLRELKANNNREWFEQNKPRYLADLRDPFLAFIAALQPRLQNVSPYLIADPKPTGGSLFRIYRDTRFAKDKTPYKTVASAYFAHQTGGKEGPGIYLHLEPDSCFLATGLYHPDPVNRRRVTDAIAARPEDWGAATTTREFRKLCRMEGEALAKLPKQYDPAHPFAEDLQRKDFIAVSQFTEKQACAKDFIDRVEHFAQVTKPFLGFIVKAVGLKW